ncbi:YidC/Oxa1 family membrane protein insertase [Angelakisella massiliensis]|uniref:YidC/Oxa1 family membrane protein insertase n=1 Tax=Angelakisella massiliensis TaxID=1871018 RepID=UPI0008F8FCCC|nr:YidC/Oxa1 family membrane protein insertase [Angelakisella massiliensis]
MGYITELLGIPLGALLSVCFLAVRNYGIAIAVFTALTKVILFPVSMWVQRNSIKMVQLTPELNQLKLKYYGDKDTIAEETQVLYKRENYHPLASTIPMFIQLILLIGVIGAVRGMLEGEDNTILVQIPSEVGGAALLMPLAAGGAALLLGLAQNHLNPLQREQGKAEQWMTNGFSIAISLVLGAFVPLGVGIYWICSNLFTILQQIILNTVIPPKKYIDYEALEKSRQELAKISSLGGKRSKEEKQREKADYKRFFSIANKHLVFYSERSGFYKYFENVIDYLLNHSNVTIHYITSDPKDAIFQKAAEQPRIKPYYIGERRLITLMMKMDADMVVMTMTDLENFHIKRSYIRKDAEYVYMFHAPLSFIMTLRDGALDHYDTIFCTGKGQVEEIRKSEEIYHLPQKKIIECGYGVIENMRKHYLENEARYKNQEVKKILIAPSWQEDNILDSCLDQILQSSLRDGWQIIVRPHPEYVKRYGARWNVLLEKYKDIPESCLILQTDFSSNETVYSADVLVSDWSGIAFEYAFATRKPVLSINTPMKVSNPNYAKVIPQPLNLTLRSEIGVQLEPDAADQAGRVLAEMLDHAEDYERKIAQLTDEYLYNMGKSGEIGGAYILQSLQKKIQSRKNSGQ